MTLYKLVATPDFGAVLVWKTSWMHVFRLTITSKGTHNYGTT